MNYPEQLKSPRWQKKRLEILDRDGFTCQHCGDTKTELHIHHLKYSKYPWEVENDKLQTLCKHCHKGIEILKRFLGDDLPPFELRNFVVKEVLGDKLLNLIYVKRHGIVLIDFFEETNTASFITNNQLETVFHKIKEREGNFEKTKSF